MGDKMFHATKNVAFAAVIFGSALVALPQDVEAASGYSVSVWSNETGLSISGRYQWGNGPWSSFSVAPGGQFATWFAQDIGNPRLTIEFDADPGPGYDTVGYQLRTYFSPTTVFNQGATEVFVIQPDGRIDLRNTRV
jgi:hypothetical protein